MNARAPSPPNLTPYPPYIPKDVVTGSTEAMSPTWTVFRMIPKATRTSLSVIDTVSALKFR